jgi:hypothetical protein
MPLIASLVFGSNPKVYPVSRSVNLTGYTLRSLADVPQQLIKPLVSLTGQVSDLLVTLPLNGVQVRPEHRDQHRGPGHRLTPERPALTLPRRQRLIVTP